MKPLGNRTHSLPAELHSLVSRKQSGSGLAGSPVAGGLPADHHEAVIAELNKCQAESPSSPEVKWSSGFFNSAKAKEAGNLAPQELFRWLSDVVQLSEDDIDAMEPCRSLPITRMAEQIYSRFAEFKAIRLHMHLDSDWQLKKRKEMMRQYLTWCLTLHHDSVESYVGHMDRIAGIHQSRLKVPVMYLLTGLAVTQDTVLRSMCQTIDDREQLQKSTCAFSKLMWIQAAFFANHANLSHQRERPLWRVLLLVWAVIAGSRSLGALLRPYRPPSLSTALSPGIHPRSRLALAAFDASMAALAAFAGRRMGVL